MYVIKRQVAAHRGIAILLALALVLWGTGFHMYTHKAKAANVTDVSDTISDSAPTEVSNHVLRFTTPNGLLTNSNFTVTFPEQFSGTTTLTLKDFDLIINGSHATLAASAGAGVWGLATSTGQGGPEVITFTAPTDGGAASSSNMVIYIGSNATSAATGANQLVNPTATSTYVIDIGGAMQDSGEALIAIIDHILVTADITTVLQFEVDGVANGQSIGASATSTATSTTKTTLPFENLVNNVSKTLAQDLYVTTNAINGYVVTFYIDSDFQSSTGAVIDGFQDGNYTNTPTAWKGPSNNVGDDTTWGHWGVTSEDATTTRTTGEFTDGGDLWISATTTPRVIMSHDGPSDGTTQGVGTARIGYQVEITGLQEAGDDYNTTLTYIATPTF